MIDWDASAELNNTTIKWLEDRFCRYPHSGIKVVVVCENCNKKRISKYSNVVKLCHACKLKSPDQRKARSDTLKKLYTAPEYINASKERADKRWSDEKQHIDASKRTSEQWKDAEIRANRIKCINKKLESIEYQTVRKEVGLKNSNNKEMHKNISNGMLQYRMNQRWNRNVMNNFIDGENIKDFISYTRNPYGIPQSDLDIWRRMVYKRDYYTCRICGRYDCLVHAHHIKMKSVYPELALDINNGITMCEECHISIYGKEKTFEEELMMMIDGVI